MNKIAAFTIVSKNYLAYARTLLSSIREFHNDVDLHLLLVDEIQDDFAKDKENFQITEAKDLLLPNFNEIAFMYDILELNTALKPFFIQHLIDKGYQKVIYFDPDIMIFNKLDIIFKHLNTYSIILTPHITRSMPEDGYRPTEQDHLVSGTYNLGFIAVSRSEETQQFIKWWSDKCRNACFSEIETGLFVDQKWVNLVPGLFDSVFVLRHVGCNMAYWNLHERKLQGIRVNETEPLVFFHFSGVNLDILDQISKYQNRYTLTERPDLREIFNLYKEKVIANDYYNCCKWAYVYGSYENGESIGPMARKLYSVIEEKHKNPFSTGHGSFYEVLKKKKLIEKYGNEKLDKTKLRSKAHIVNRLLLIVNKLLGPERYYNLMKYMRYISVIRRQKFIVE